MTEKKIPDAWKRRRTRVDPPDLHEAITAAQCLTEEIDAQVEIASQLMGMSPELVRREVLKLSRLPPARSVPNPIATRGARPVVVEHRKRRIVQVNASKP
ncbi:hypothetical protein [Microvirga antarctica]|uniref:hypothetical protein n=1 Tax=Microvirga antarctica TaxID=2819233 RepID=UPI001B3052A7|nr:hypothetical protein [Microvirga antarctica]